MRSYPRFTGGGPFRPPAGTATESNPSAFPLPGVYSGCSHSSPTATAAAASSSTLAPRLAARPRTALRLPPPPRFPFHPDPASLPGLTPAHALPQEDLVPGAGWLPEEIEVLLRQFCAGHATERGDV